MRKDSAPGTQVLAAEEACMQSDLARRLISACRRTHLAGSVRRSGASRAAYTSLPHVRAARTASMDLWAREGPVEAILALAVHRGIAL